MTAIFVVLATYEPLFRGALEIGLTSIIRVALPLAFGLSALRAIGKRELEARRVVSNASLASAAAVLIFSIGCSVAPTSLPALWSIHLPASHPLTTHLSAVRQSYAKATVVTRQQVSSVAGSDAYLLATTPSHTAVEIQAPLSPDVIGSEPAITAPLVSSVEPGSHAGWMTSPGFGSVAAGVTVCWIAGSFGLLAWIMFSAGSIAWRLGQGRDVEDGPTLAMLEDLCTRKGVCPPRLVACPRVLSPFVTGLIRPTLSLPDSYLTDFEPEALRAILAHEVMHLVQYDCLWTLLSRILCALCWPLPLVWALCRQREALSEESCDTAVLNEGCSPTVYARCLLSLAERLRPLRPERVAGVGALTARSGLGRRIERILAGTHAKHPPLPQCVRLGFVVAAICVILPCMVLVGQAAPKGLRSPGQEIEPAQSNSTPGSHSSEQTGPGQTPANPDALAKQVEAERRARAVDEAAARNMQRADLQRIMAQEASLEAKHLKAVEARRQSVETMLRSKSFAASNGRTWRALRAEQARLLRVQSDLKRLELDIRRAADTLAHAAHAQQDVAATSRLRVNALQTEIAIRREEVSAQQAQMEAARASLAQAETSMQSARAKYTDAAPQVQQAQAALQQAEANVAAQAEQQARLVQQRSTTRRSTADQQAVEALERAARVDVTAQRARTEAAKAELAQAQSMLQSARADYKDTAPQVQQADAALRQARANVAAQQAQLAADQAAVLADRNRAVEALQKARANVAAQQAQLAADQAAALSAQKRAVEALRKARDEAAQRKALRGHAH